MKKILLVLPQFFETNNNTGITLQNIFFKYDKSLISEIVLTANDGGKALEKSHVFSKKKHRGHIYNLFHTLCNLHSKELNRFLNNVKPDIIYCVCSTIQTAMVALYIKRKLHIPVIVHHFDNVRQTAKLHLIHSILYNKLERKMNCGLVISEAMKEAYEKKYKHKYNVLMNCVNTEPKEVSANFSKDYYLVLFAGGLHLNRLKSLSDIYRTFSSWNLTHSKKIILEVFTPDIDLCKRELCGDNLIINASINHYDLIKRYHNYDALVHVETFDEKEFDFLKYSISTKLPEYLYSGKPILCYAPEKSAIALFLNKHKAGFVASNPKDLVGAIEHLFDPKIAATLISNAEKIVQAKFSYDSSNKVLMDTIHLNCLENE